MSSINNDEKGNKEDIGFDYNKHTWEIFDNYFNNPYTLVSHQLSSFNDFIKNVIPTIIENNNPIKIHLPKGGIYTIYIKNCRYKNPEYTDNNTITRVLYPLEARLRSLSYMSQLIVDVQHFRTKGDVEKELKSEENIPLCKIPAMLHSNICNLKGLTEDELVKNGECKYDIGGYFIVNGGEKVIVSQERVSENRVFVWPPSKNTTNKFSHECEIKSSIDQRFNPVETFKVMLSRSQKEDKMLKCKISGFKTEVHLFVLIRALGIRTDKEIFFMMLGEYIHNENFFTLLQHSNITEINSDKDAGGGMTSIPLYTQDDAINYLTTILNQSYGTTSDSEDKKKLVVDIINRKLLPHCGISYRKKALFIGYMVQRLMLSYFNVRPYDDRDHYSNKRLNTSGTLLCQIFRTYYINLIKDIKRTIGNYHGQDAYPNIRKLISSSSIESRLKYVLSTGNWGTNKNRDSASDKGVAQVLTRLGYNSYISHIRRVHSPLEHSGNKIIKPRKLHMTHYGMCCPNETPEGAQIGILKNLAMQCKISIHSSDYILKQIILKIKDNITNVPFVIDSNNINIEDCQKCTRIIINGDIFGYVLISKTKELYDILLTLKRYNKINYETSIAWYIEWGEILIQTDGGRYMRPLHIVSNNGNLLIKERFNELYHPDAPENNKFIWDELVAPSMTINSSNASNASNASKSIKHEITKYNGAVIEYLDTNELENTMIAMTPEDLIYNRSKWHKVDEPYIKYTHCEIHPTMMLGVVAQMIPASDCNQSPRNIYQSSMGKQAVGYYVTNFNSRFDTMGHILVYGERPLYTTRTTKYTSLNKLPHGTNAMLLIAPFDGYNQEDATVINYDSVQRGFFNTLYFRSYVDTETKHKTANANNEEFTNPKGNIIDKKIGDYTCIDSNGVPIVGKYIDESGAIIGKVVQIKDPVDNSFKNKDISTMIRAHEN